LGLDYSPWPFFLSEADMKTYDSRCEISKCSVSPYPTFSQPGCQCAALLDGSSFAKATQADQKKIIDQYDVVFPFVKGTAEYTNLKVSGSTSPCYLKLSSEVDSFKYKHAR
jgi:hypothetical protein